VEIAGLLVAGKRRAADRQQHSASLVKNVQSAITDLVSLEERDQLVGACIGQDLHAIVALAVSHVVSRADCRV